MSDPPPLPAGDAELLSKTLDKGGLLGRRLAGKVPRCKDWPHQTDVGVVPAGQNAKCLPLAQKSGRREGLQRSGVDASLCSRCACLHTAFTH